ncbi:hypothetical protein BCT46_05095 [Vibrio sp. 10N.261.46.E8]|nr:hypothetical protein BH584_10160 [Vibrio sp. 10N.261.45.E1]PMJ24586.1 hypothetical protein BCU27_13070 [Vibrio sp. 10N.286.45.B6]PML92630.1 hypothetical protein BCT66_25140 [Vibrio sp. 10N.261.49.E11]PMM67783.1 hypothetical protein BCT48_13680 [Vibrio sp. 10N.261.46.F12]PMM88523.1 hypothetical protein BCT46_05095 [Vibrio sp. 10N.261.46.E8]PMN34474.1 hypothetical protein BCT34_10250 [Vibrio sp. 10N.261.45.E2]PMN48053.1 hypothetical protein BCT32_07790 [Vibrio sp. 10N.261.45.E11]PMN81678.1 
MSIKFEQFYNLIAEYNIRQTIDLDNANYLAFRQIKGAILSAIQPKYTDRHTIKITIHTEK